MNKYFIVGTLLLSGMVFSCKDNLKQGIYEGQNLSETASIIRDKDSKEASLSIGIDGNWTLYSGLSDDAIDYSKSFSGTGKGIFPITVNDSVRSYFQLITDDGKAILADKHLPMAGGFNFRDLGGIKTSDNKFVRWGKFFRTDELGNLTNEDLAYLSSIPVQTVVDFRSEQEVSALPDKLPKSVKKYTNLNISPGNLHLNSLEELTRVGDFEDFMISMNRSFVTDTAIIAQYKEFFSILQNEENLPVIFHCTAGKDRTGMGAALILFALGVDEETVMKDYLLSNVYLQNKYKDIIEKHPAIKPMLIVEPEYIQASIDLIKEKYGNVDNYLTSVLGVDLVKFKQKYLY